MGFDFLARESDVLEEALLLRPVFEEPPVLDPLCSDPGDAEGEDSSDFCGTPRRGEDNDPLAINPNRFRRLNLFVSLEVVPL